MNQERANLLCRIQTDLEDIIDYCMKGKDFITNYGIEEDELAMMCKSYKELLYNKYLALAIDVDKFYDTTDF